MDLDGFAITISRDATDGMVTVQIDTSKAHRNDTYGPPHAIPKLRIVVNDRSDILCPQGQWVEEPAAGGRTSA